jgi:hypothetical protein
MSKRDFISAVWGGIVLVLVFPIAYFVGRVIFGG